MAEQNPPPIRYDRPYQRDEHSHPISPPELYDLQQGPYSPTYNSFFRGTYFDSRPTQQSGVQQPHEGFYGGQPLVEALGDSTRPYELPDGSYQAYQYNHPQQQTDYQGYVPPPAGESLKPVSNQLPKPHRSPHFYMPPILRLHSLLIVFLISAGIIGVIQYAIEKLPHAERGSLDNLFGHSPTTTVTVQRRGTAATLADILPTQINQVQIPAVVTTPPAVKDPSKTLDARGAPAQSPPETPDVKPESSYVPTAPPPDPPKQDAPAAGGPTTNPQPQQVNGGTTTVPGNTANGGGYVPTPNPPANPVTTTPPANTPTGTTPAGEYVPTSPPADYVPTTNPEAAVQTTNPPPDTSTPPPAPPPSSEGHASYVPTTNPAPPASTAPPAPPPSSEGQASYVPTTNPSNPPTPPPTGYSGGYVPSTNPGGNPTETGTGGAYVPTTNPANGPASGTPGTPTPQVIVASSYVPTDGPSLTPTTIGSSYVATATGGSYVPTGGPTVSGGAVALAQSGSITPGGTASVAGYTLAPMTSMVTLTGTFVTSVPSVIVTTNAEGQPTTITTLVPSTTVGTEVVPTISYFNSQANKSALFPVWKVFVGNNYMILLIAVLLRQIWAAIYGQAKLIEPFTHLEDPGGVPARQVLDSFYLSGTFTPDPIIAIARRHWFILWTSVVYLSIGFLGPIGSEMQFLDMNYPNCPYQNSNNPTNFCFPPRLSIDPTLARALQGLMTFVAIMTLTLMVMVWRMRSGVYSDPSAIATVASLVHHPEVLEDFRSFGPEASLKDIMRVIGRKWYKLDEYQRPDGCWRYGIVPAAPGQLGHEEVPYEDLKAPAPKYRRWKLLDAIADTAFLVLLLGLLGVVAAYYKDGKSDGFNNFFNNAKFGPRFLLTSIGTIIAINWRRLERDVHTLSVYHKMAETPSDARSTILLRKGSIPLTSIFPMLFKKHFFAAFMAFVAVLSEPLIIFLGAVPYQSGEVWLELLIASYTCMAILGLMVLAVLALMVWKRRLPDLPRSPDTVAAVMSYVSESKMLEDFDGCEYADDRELVQRIAGSGKRYVYGKKPGTDGVNRYLVDEEDSNVYHS